MLDSFVIFILSHGRAGNVITLDTLRSCGYSGEWRLVVDDEDEQKDDYISAYGADRVVIFSKSEYAEKVDTISICDKPKSPVFARNAICDLAVKSGCKWFGMWDDDIKNVLFRYASEGKLRGKKVSDLDSVFSAMIDFMQEAGADAMAFANAGGMMGGIHGAWSEGLRQIVCNTYIIRTGSRSPFIGVFNEDLHYSFLKTSVGEMVFEIMGICFMAPERGTNSGGLSDFYKEQNARNWFEMNVQSLVCCPSMVRINPASGKGLSMLRKNATPCIVSSRWKK